MVSEEKTMNINFDSYKVFYYVAKYQNITLAAKALFLSQPTVSHIIAGLENALGCQLFLRSKKGVALTPEGELLYQSVARACQELWNGQKILEEHLALQDGFVRIGASETTLHHFLLPYLEQFRLRYPHIRLKISNTTTPKALAALKEGSIDFAVVISPENESGLTIVETSPLSDIFIAGNQFSELKDIPVTIEELSRYPLVCREQGTSSREYLDRIFQAHQCQLIPDIELATTDLITPMVAHNLGIGFVPCDFAHSALDAGTVFALHLTEALPKRTICIVKEAARPLSAAGNSLFQMLLV